MNHEKNQSEHKPQRGERQKKPLRKMAGHQRESAERLDGEDLAVFAGCCSLLGATGGVAGSGAAGLTRCTFTRATRLPSISTTVKRYPPYSKFSPPRGIEPS